MASKLLKAVSTALPGIKGAIPKYKHGTFRFSSTLGQHSVETTTQNNLVAADELQVIDPLQEKDFFGVRKLVTMKDLFDAKVHWGHKSGVRNILMRPFLFGTRLNIDIINLEKTLPLLIDALNFTAHVAYREGIILFISRNKRTLHHVERAASECKEYAQCRAWKDGTFTNATSEFGSITRLPDLCLFISTHDTVFQEHAALLEAAKCNIPSIGILDTSCDPRFVTYPVPGNDDSPSAVELYCNLFKQAVLLGKNKRKEMQENGIADENEVD